MTTLLLKYRLKPGVTRADFENWVRTFDQPTMRGLKRITSFETYRVEKLLIGEGAPSADYIEVFEISDMAGFTSDDLPGATVQGVMGQFMGFAEAPEFLIAERV